MHYALLALSIVLEIFGTTMLKFSEGFTVFGPSALTALSYIASFSLFVIVLKKVPLGLAYGIWGGAGTAATTVIGCVVWGDPFSLFTGLGIALVSVGIYLMNAGSKKDKEHAQQVQAAVSAH